jgi:hypothetical protein
MQSAAWPHVHITDGCCMHRRVCAQHLGVCRMWGWACAAQHKPLYGQSAVGGHAVARRLCKGCVDTECGFNPCVRGRMPRQSLFLAVLVQQSCTACTGVKQRQVLSYPGDGVLVGAAGRGPYEE